MWQHCGMANRTMWQHCDLASRTMWHCGMANITMWQHCGMVNGTNTTGPQRSGDIDDNKLITYRNNNHDYNNK